MTTPTTLGGHETVTGDADRSPLPELGPGAEFGRYVVVERLGAGGMGVVLAAEDPRLGRRVAIKVLFDAETGERGERRRARMIREAQAMAAISHPNVVTVLDVGEAVGRVFLAMELVEGQTLRAWLDVAGRSAEEILAVFRDAGQGLVAVHAAGLVHRDFKPENVLIGLDGRARVTDFGVVGGEMSSHSERLDMASAPTTDLTRDGALVGTPAYMAPEQVAGRRADHHSDQFSFCVALYEALFGVTPYVGETLAQRVVSWSSGGVQPPARNAVSIRIRRALVRGLDPIPARRWPTMTALLAELAPRRSWRGPATGAIVVAVGAAAFAAIGGLTEDACRLPGLADTWSADTRAAVRTAVENAGEPAALWNPVEAALDRYAQRWLTARDTVCAARLDPDLHDIAAACLSSRRRAFAAVTELFAEPTHEIVLGAGAAVEGLSSPESCSEPDRTPAALARTRVDPETLAFIDDAIAFEPRIDLGEPERSRRVVEAARQQAGAAGLCREEAQLTFLVGRLERRVGNFEAQVKALEGAYAIAFDCEEFDQAALMAARVVAARTAELDDLDGAALWAGHADAALARAASRAAAPFVLDARARLAFRSGNGRDTERHARAALAELRDPAVQPRLTARLYTTLALGLRQQGELDEAVVAQRRAIELYEARAGAMHPDIAAMLNGLANLEGARGETERSAETYRRTLAVWRASAPDDPRVFMTVANLALALRLQGRYAEALAAFDEALPMARKHYADSSFSARVRLQRARTLARAGRFDEAEREALAGRDSVRGGLAEYLGVLALAENELARGNLEDAQAWMRELPDTCDHLKNDFCHGLELLIGGQIQLAQGDTAKAIDTLLSAHELLPHGEIDYVRPLPADVTTALVNPD